MAAAHHDVVDDFACFIVLSATLRRWHTPGFYTPAAGGASTAWANPPPKTAPAESTLAAAPLIPGARRNVGHGGRSCGELLRCGVTLCAALAFRSILQAKSII